jgi:capsular polysaccharide transport system permease protein
MNPTVAARPARQHSGPLGTMWRVLFALILRESRTRYGRHRLGYAWALLGPTAQVCALAFVWALLGRTSHSGIDLVPLIITGVVSLHAFMQISGRMAGALNANRALLMYPPVHTADPLIARAILETLTAFVILCLLLGGAAILGYTVPCGNLALAMWAFVCGAVFAAGYGFLLSAASRTTALADRASTFINRALFYTSGVFFTLDMLPMQAAQTLSWVPMAQMIETLRAGLFPDAGLSYSDPLYLGWCAIVTLGLGLSAHRLVERLPSHRLPGFGDAA